ncbi:uncharacterized protein LOC142338572 [Convolutriloba macropyga]|uniref:uncharacterized protein LOC142338572 n=1 Tax=Convolutriloba macropyga TaxID=536237 RepID=UPI003F51FDBA
MMLNSKCISLLPVAILASLIHVAIVNSYFIDSDQIAKRFDQIPEEQSLRDILTDDDSESDENEEFQNFDLEDPADHGSIPEVKKRTLVIQGIKHYKTSMICGHGDVCKIPGVPAFECLCPLHTYCTAQGKWYNSVCGSSLYSLVYKQRG